MNAQFFRNCEITSKIEIPAAWTLSDLGRNIFHFFFRHYRFNMASKNTKPRAQTYSMLTDVQKDILTRRYDGGMPGGGGYSRQFRIGVCRQGSQTLTLFKGRKSRIDTLLKAQNQEMAPYLRETR